MIDTVNINNKNIGLKTATKYLYSVLCFQTSGLCRQMIALSECVSQKGHTMGTDEELFGRAMVSFIFFYGIYTCDSTSWRRPVTIFLLGSFRLQSTCRYQRSREDVCPQHKATGHVSKYVNSRCAIENCLMSARNIRATAHAPCSQHTFNRNLELKTDQFHGVYRLVTPST